MSIQWKPFDPELPGIMITVDDFLFRAGSELTPANGDGFWANTIGVSNASVWNEDVISTRPLSATHVLWIACEAPE